ncbi:hypothetical protein SVIOM342S_10194 [Streptomyces violaceorubidus]
MELGEQAGDGGLARAGLPHQSRDGAASQPERDVVDGVDAAAFAGEQVAGGAAQGKVFGDSARFQHHVGAGGRGLGAGPRACSG